MGVSRTLHGMILRDFGVDAERVPDQNPEAMAA